MSRSLKQLLYSLFYIIVFILIFGILSSVILKQPATCVDEIKNQDETGIDCGGICISCELKNIQPVEFLGYSIMPLKSGRVSLLVHIKNPNETHHASPFLYSIHLFDENNIERESFGGMASLEAGSDGYVLEANALYSNPKDVKFEINEVNWKSKESFSAPEIVIENATTTIEKNIVRVKGMIENKSSFESENIHIIAVLSGDYNEDIFASEMVLTRLTPFRKEQFSVVFPNDAEIVQRLKTNTTRIIVQAE